MKTPLISVIICTYNRPALLQRLIDQLSNQNLKKDDYEVIVVDDGSALPAREALSSYKEKLNLKILTQTNQGQASARQNGSNQAHGDILLFIDDDMNIEPSFLEEHLRSHKGSTKTVVYGKIAPSKNIKDLPIFERYHAHMLHLMYRGFRLNAIKPKGVHLCTGNVSVMRDFFIKVGGFDLSLKRSEDRELGIRLEKAGANFIFSERAKSTHDSDHQSLKVWMKRAHLYGIYDQTIFEKHPEFEGACPWRFISLVHTLSKPILIASAKYPSLAKLAGLTLIYGAYGLSKLGLGKLAIKLTTLVYGIQYFRGVRERLGSRTKVIEAFNHYKKASLTGKKKSFSALGYFIHAVKEDHRSITRYRAKYHGDEASNKILLNLIVKIGFQIMFTYRTMRLFRDLKIPLMPMIISRLIRYTYASEIHWETTIEPGVSIVHGNGLVLGKGAYVSAGCILFQNVTLGEGIDPVSGCIGSPRLEKDVHVGPGATIIGPILIGAQSKIAAGCVVQETILEKSIVIPPKPIIKIKREPVMDMTRSSMYQQV